MSSSYPLVGYYFAILEDKIIRVTGRIIQGNGGAGYLVRFESTPSYTRVYPIDAPFFSGINLFETEDELGDFVHFVHTQTHPVVELPEETDVEPEDTDNPAVA